MASGKRILFLLIFICVQNLTICRHLSHLRRANNANSNSVNSRSRTNSNANSRRSNSITENSRQSSTRASQTDTLGRDASGTRNRKTLRPVRKTDVDRTMSGLGGAMGNMLPSPINKFIQDLRSNMPNLSIGIGASFGKRGRSRDRGTQSRRQQRFQDTPDRNRNTIETNQADPLLDLRDPFPVDSRNSLPSVDNLAPRFDRNRDALPLPDFSSQLGMQNNQIAGKGDPWMQSGNFLDRFAPEPQILLSGRQQTSPTLNAATPNLNSPSRITQDQSLSANRQSSLQLNNNNQALAPNAIANTPVPSRGLFVNPSQMLPQGQLIQNQGLNSNLQIPNLGSNNQAQGQISQSLLNSLVQQQVNGQSQSVNQLLNAQNQLQSQTSLLNNQLNSPQMLPQGTYPQSQNQLINNQLNQNHLINNQLNQNQLIQNQLIQNQLNQNQLLQNKLNQNQIMNNINRVIPGQQLQGQTNLGTAQGQSASVIQNLLKQAFNQPQTQATTNSLLRPNKIQQSISPLGNTGFSVQGMGNQLITQPQNIMQNNAQLQQHVLQRGGQIQNQQTIQGQSQQTAALTSLLQQLLNKLDNKPTNAGVATVSLPKVISSQPGNSGQLVNNNAIIAQLQQSMAQQQNGNPMQQNIPQNQQQNIVQNQLLNNLQNIRQSQPSNIAQNQQLNGLQNIRQNQQSNTAQNQLQNVLQNILTNQQPNIVPNQQQNRLQNSLQNKQPNMIQNQQQIGLQNIPQNQQPTVVHNRQPNVVQNQQPNVVQNQQPNVVQNQQPNIVQNQEQNGLQNLIQQLLQSQNQPQPQPQPNQQLLHSSQNKLQAQQNQQLLQPQTQPQAQLNQQSFQNNNLLLGVKSNSGAQAIQSLQPTQQSQPVVTQNSMVDQGNSILQALLSNNQNNPQPTTNVLKTANKQSKSNTGSSNDNQLNVGLLLEQLKLLQQAKKQNQGNQVNQQNQANQVNQQNQANQVNQQNQANQVNQLNQANPVNQQNQANPVNQQNKANPVNQQNQNVVIPSQQQKIVDSNQQNLQQLLTQLLSNQGNTNDNTASTKLNLLDLLGKSQQPIQNQQPTQTPKPVIPPFMVGEIEIAPPITLNTVQEIPTTISPLTAVNKTAQGFIMPSQRQKQDQQLSVSNNLPLEVTGSSQPTPVREGVTQETTKITQGVETSLETTTNNTLVIQLNNTSKGIRLVPDGQGGVRIINLRAAASTHTPWIESKNETLSAQGVVATTEGLHILAQQNPTNETLRKLERTDRLNTTDIPEEIELANGTSLDGPGPTPAMPSLYKRKLTTVTTPAIPVQNKTTTTYVPTTTPKGEAEETTTPMDYGDMEIEAEDMLSTTSSAEITETTTTPPTTTKLTIPTKTTKLTTPPKSTTVKTTVNTTAGPTTLKTTTITTTVTPTTTPGTLIHTALGWLSPYTTTPVSALDVIVAGGLLNINDHTMQTKAHELALYDILSEVMHKKMKGLK